MTLVILGAGGLWQTPPVDAGIAIGTFTVDTTVDDPARDSCALVPDDCSLRGAVIRANGISGAQTIIIPAGTYVLTSTGAESASTGDLDISQSLTITVSANRAGDVATINGGSTGDRVIAINCGAVCTVNGSNLKITGGGPMPVGGSGAGGGIHINNTNVTLNLDNSTITNNVTGNGVTVGHRLGGGISNDGGTLRLSNSAVTNNSALSPGGGSFASGGGIYNGGALVLTNSTISGNSVNDGASATATGGGIRHFTTSTSQPSGMANITNTTITDNTSDPGNGGGIGVSNSVGTFKLSNTTIANNTGGDCGGPAVILFDSLGANNDSDDSCNLDQPSDIPGTDPELGGLGFHGGLTANHVPMAGSPLLDTGFNTTCNTLTDAFGDPDATDQRGKPRKSAGDLTPGTRCDIGAAEFVAANCNSKTPSLVGTNGPDSGTGTSGDDVVVLLGGSDDYDGAGGSDDVCGGSGTDDQVNGGAGPDALSGGAGGSDDCFGDGGGDSFIGGTQAASGCETATSIP